MWISIRGSPFGSAGTVTSTNVKTQSVRALSFDGLAEISRAWPRARSRPVRSRSAATAAARAAFSSSVAPGRSSGSLCWRMRASPVSRTAISHSSARAATSPSNVLTCTTQRCFGRYDPTSSVRRASPAVSDTNSFGPPSPLSGTGNTRHCGPSVTPRASSAWRAISAACVREIVSLPRSRLASVPYAQPIRLMAPIASQAVRARGLRACRAIAAVDSVRSGAAGGCHAALRSPEDSSVHRPICSLRERTIHSGTSVTSTTITCWIQIPGAFATKMGSANQTTSNVKCRMIPGSRPK